MNIRYVIEVSNGYLWEEEDHFETLDEAKQEITKLRSSTKTKRRIIRQQWEVIEE